MDHRRGSRPAEPGVTVTRRTTPAAARSGGTVTGEPPMTDSPRMRLAAGEPKTPAAGPCPGAGAVPASGRCDPPGRRGLGAGRRGRDRCAAACPAPAGCGRDHRGRARDRGRAGADRPGPGDDRGGGAGAAGRRAAVPPVPGAGHRGGRVRGGGGADGRDHLPGRAGRHCWAARRAAPGFLAGRRRLPRSGRPGGTGGGRGGRGAVAEPAVAPGGLGHAAADRRGPAGHRRAAAACSWCWRWPPG